MRNLPLTYIGEHSKEFNKRKCCLLIQSSFRLVIINNQLLLDGFTYHYITGLSETVCIPGVAMCHTHGKY